MARDVHVNTEGIVSPKWSGVEVKEENSGGFVNYYLVCVAHPQRSDQAPYQAECEDIIEALELNFDEANIFKEIWRGARARQGTKKAGNNELRGAQKIVHYGNRILRRAERSIKETTPTPETAWIEWDGKSDFPLGLSDTTKVRVMTRNSHLGQGAAMDFSWKHRKDAHVTINRDGDILRYLVL